MCGIYGISGFDIYGDIGDISFGAICDCRCRIMAISIIGERHSQEIFLVPGGDGNRRRDIGNMPIDADIE